MGHRDGASTSVATTKMDATMVSNKSINNENIPENSGLSTVTNSRINITLNIYKIMAVASVLLLATDQNTRLQHVGLALLLPGGSFIGMGGWWILVFPLAMLSFAFSLFLWFASGNIIAPIVTWPGLALIVPLIPPASHVTTHSTFVTPILSAAIYYYFSSSASKVYAKQLENRQRRNEFLPSAISKLESLSGEVSAPQNPEMKPEELGQLRFVLETAMQADDDWTNYNVIDQFQTSAVRYQICEQIYVLSLANKLYTPSFRGGYLEKAQKKLIQKYCQEFVLKYWKYECLWGKLSTNYEPVLKDNIMLTGFYLLAISMYESATGDDAYSKEGALLLEIDKRHKYRHSTETFADALRKNFMGSPYTLYACEPNWIYTFCNLTGANALLTNDMNRGTDIYTRLKERFEKGFVEEFMTHDGSGIPIRSHITGLTIPGIVGAANDFSLAALTVAALPELSKRTYAIAKEEYIGFDKNSEIYFKGLQGADKMDPGKYAASMATIYACVLMSAREHGDYEVAQAVEKLIDSDLSLKRKDEHGVISYEDVSLLMKCQILRARLMYKGAWKKMLTEPMNDTLRNGPYLCDAKYPEVLISKAISNTGKDLELVLYPGTKKNRVCIGLRQLEPNSEYTVNNNQKFTSNGLGEATIEVELNGRTHIAIV